MIGRLCKRVTQKQYCFFYWKRLCVFCLAIMLMVPVAWAVDYSLDYAAIGIGGDQSQTADYEVVWLLKADGVDGEPQASTDYSVTSTTGFKEDTETRVDDWMLY